MRGIDYLSVFFLLGSAPGWQSELDNLCAGLGSSLLIILLIAAIHSSRADAENHRSPSAQRPTTHEI